MEINKQLGALMGMTSIKTAREILTSEDSELPKGTDLKVTENDVSYIVDMKVKDLAFIKEEEGLKARVLLNGDIEVRITGPEEKTEEETAEEEEDFDMPGVEAYMDYKIEMPGKIKSITGVGNELVKKISDTKFSIHDDTKIPFEVVIISSVEKSLVDQITSFFKKTTITCVKGKSTKKVTGKNPVCPSGYKKK